MISIVGWIGAISFVVAYGLLSIGKLKSSSYLYHFLNALGGICLIINALDRLDMPGFFVNLVWLGIAVFSIARVYLLKKSKKQPHNLDDIKIRKPLPFQKY